MTDIDIQIAELELRLASLRETQQEARQARLNSVQRRYQFTLERVGTQPGQRPVNRPELEAAGHSVDSRMMSERCILGELAGVAQRVLVRRLRETISLLEKAITAVESN